MTAREIAALKRRIRDLERDRMFARSLLLPGQVAVYKSAMAWEHVWREGKIWWPLAQKTLNACARARKGE